LRALVLSAISADIFYGKNFGAILGYFTLSIGVGGAAGSWLGGARNGYGTSQGKVR